ncbi:hypothetical protein LTR53_004739 [Teratosphaeriaceae sp. CCFEE 6253]|nr:hypothetical protein LTR53_004739 [Teratosphaeriaceae sp. CCFEE 6253]
MSTFDGIVKEFPDIRIDYFRETSAVSQPPLAYFLSHVHTDHLTGLEACKSPFIYCSPATREILLRLEKYPHRMNFAKGIVEKHLQTYKHLKKLLKPIPLETPTRIELSPGHSIRVTLFDANHCVGAVCFLIEGEGKAVLYTGDVRSEGWWVNSLCRNPLFLPYVSSIGAFRAPLKRLDCIYLDTTFAAKDDVHRQFPSKANGVAELLASVSKYPKDTVFYFDSWTFGYEDVWQALSAYLGSQIHVDDYRYRIYLALKNGPEPRAPEAAKLIGFHCGNHYEEGCLTPEQAQLHSYFVRITPIISRHKGMDIAELGAGGGHGDLSSRHSLELHDVAAVGQLMALCVSKLQAQPQLLASVMELLSGFISGQVSSVSLDGLGFVEDGTRVADGDDFVRVDDLPMDRLVPALAKLVTKAKIKKSETPLRSSKTAVKRPDGLAKQITFPYSRHSSYGELCGLIDAFKPMDIHPCTVDKTKWDPTQSMEYLLGHIYASTQSFTHDQMMLGKRDLAIRTSFNPRASSNKGDEKSEDDWQQTEQRHRDELRRGHKASLGVSPSIDRRGNEPSITGDFWPPKGFRDHYAPPQQPRRRRSAKALSPDSAVAREPSRRASLSADSHISAARLPHLLSKRRSDNDMHGQGIYVDGHNSKRRRQSSDHEPREGRLSPPFLEAERDPSDVFREGRITASEGRRLIFHNLAKQASKSDLRKFCAGYAIEDVYIPPFPSDKHVGLGFVDFSTPAEARRAISELQGKSLWGREIRVNLTRESTSDSAHRKGSNPVNDDQNTIEHDDESLPPSSGEARLALRREAYDAALHGNGMDWSRLGLVSTGDGHHIKEEEL